MRVWKQWFVGSLAMLALAGCGGGGGGGDSSAFQPGGIRVTVTPVAPQTTPFSLTGITVRVTGENGQPFTDGTQVNLQVSPSGVGLVSSGQVNGTVPPNAGGESVVSERVSAQLSGGIANFRFHSRAVGTAVLTASVQESAGSIRTYSGSGSVAVVAGPPNDPRLTIQLSGSSTLPVNRVGINYNSPYYTPVTVTWRNLDGTIAVPRAEDEAVGVSVTPTETAFFTVLDDPDTTEVNENFVALGQGPVNVVAGRAFFRVFSSSNPGTATLAVSVVDQLTGETISATQAFTVTNGTPGVPGAVVFDTDDSAIYIQGINAPSTKPIQVRLFDGGGAFVPNPAAGVNNVRLDLVSSLAGGERLTGINAAGTTVQGSTLSIRTNSGEANFALQTGTVAGTVVVRATADRADNNVDNGITDPVVATRQVTISDGRIFDIQIQTADFDPASPQVEGPPPGNTSPDATYQMLVTTLATDRNGNPVPAGAEIRFGLLDEPQNSSGQFLIQGTDGNPQENGPTFVAQAGAFTTAGGGVGPGDTLVVLAEPIPGNRDMEAARTVQSVQSNSQLTVTQVFNPNDVTGTSVDAGPIYPYVIGRAADANVLASGLTNSVGVASSVVTYPARRLGKRIILWAQGNGTLVTGGRPRIVSDVETFNLPGAGPATVTANPGGIVANRTTLVRVCAKDSSGNPLPNANIEFAFIQPATGSVDSIPGTGFTPPTGSNGCVSVNVLANLVPGATGEGSVLFSVGGGEAEVTVTAQGRPTLAIGPNPVPVFAGPPGQIAPIAVCVNDGGGPIPNVVISGTCTIPTPATAPGGPGTVTLNVPQTTNIDGCAVVFATYTQMAVQNGAAPELRNSTCTFNTNNALTGTVQVVGTRRCGDGLTPAPVGCPP
jgi:hypothetical protein